MLLHLRSSCSLGILDFSIDTQVTSLGVRPLVVIQRPFHVGPVILVLPINEGA